MNLNLANLQMTSREFQILNPKAVNGEAYLHNNGGNDGKKYLHKRIILN